MKYEDWLRKGHLRIKYADYSYVLFLKMFTSTLIE